MNFTLTEVLFSWLCFLPVGIFRVLGSHWRHIEHSGRGLGRLPKIWSVSKLDIPAGTPGLCLERVTSEVVSNLEALKLFALDPKPSATPQPTTKPQN